MQDLKNDPTNEDQDKENNGPAIEDQKAKEKREEQEKNKAFLAMIGRIILIAIITMFIFALFCKWYKGAPSDAGTSLDNGGNTEIQKDTTDPVTDTSDPVLPTKAEMKTTTTAKTKYDLCNLRSLPNGSSAQIGQILKKGTSLELIGINSEKNWIETTQGWIDKKLLDNVPSGLPESNGTHSAPAGWTKKEGGRDDPGSTSSVQSHGDQ